MKSSNRETIQLTLSDGSSVAATDYGDFLILKRPSNLASLGKAIYHAQFDFLDEVIVTEVEICLALNDQYESGLLSEIAALKIGLAEDSAPAIHDFGIWFSDEFDDWKLICDHTGISKDDYIERLLNCELSIAMIGFLPGFVYLGGLPEELHVPRKKSPALRMLPNTLAIGGKYAGIYALPSAAGWNCVGRISPQLFDVGKLPPLSVSQGDTVKLKQIDRSTFEASQTIPNDKQVRRPADESCSLTIEKPGMLTLIQDRGRHGMSYFAIPRCGAMDADCFDLANTLLGNSADAAAIECHFVAPTIRFASAATICLTGANMKWRIDGKKANLNQTIEVVAGSVLSGSSAKKGCRGYIGIAGEIQADSTFGSKACYLPGHFGGNEGKAFSKGDQLHWVEPSKPPMSLALDIESFHPDGPLDIVPGPEFDWLDDKSKAALSNEPFQVTPASDRMGARLSGPELSTGNRRLDDSVPLLPGMIQLTPSGQCIVVLRDGQTTGGYPRIGFLNRRTVQRLNQTPIGQPFRFTIVY